MDFHHDTSLGSILEDDSISSTSRTCIRFCLGERASLWLVGKPSIYSFHIAHSTFTSTLCFRLSLIQPSASNILMCECGHGLDAFGMHLVCCSFGGLQIATHDVIRDVMYVFIQDNGHAIWREEWYVLTSKVSL
jgi:hypothetical protein